MELIKGIPLKQDRIFFIADIGTNFIDLANNENYLYSALELAETAIYAGADVVKFQVYEPETLIANQLTKDRAYYEQYSLNIYFYKKLANELTKLKLPFTFTLFSEDYIEAFAECLPFFKVALLDANNYYLIDKIIKYNKPIVISLGNFRLPEILEDKDLVIMHCVGEYPATKPFLRNIHNLKLLYPKYVVGYSDHTEYRISGIEPLILAWISGAQVIEKHFTLDTSLNFNDHFHSIDAAGIMRLRNEEDRLRRIMFDTPNSYKYPLPYKVLAAKCKISAGEELTFQNTTALKVKIPALYASSNILFDPKNKYYAKRTLLKGEAIKLSDITNERN